TMTAGQPYSVSVTMKNTGTATWTAATDYKLGSQNPQDNTTWGTSRVALAASVAPGAQYTFTYNVTAPATPGTYNFQWKMLREAVGWFGASSTNTAVNITASANHPTLSVQRTPAPLVAGQNHTLTWSTTKATSVTYTCTASGTGFTGSATLATSGTTTNATSAAWIGYPSTCTWRATGAGGSTTQTETMTTVAAPVVDAVTYFHNDIAGTPQLATNASGALVWKENYLPYGQRQAKAPASAGNKLWYTGKPHEEDTGLTYMGARYYMPLVGRFTGMDPVDIVPGQPHSLNRYAYGNNNPYRYVDRDGKSATLAIRVGILGAEGGFLACGPVCGAIGGGVGVAAALYAGDKALNWLKSEGATNDGSKGEPNKGADSETPAIHEGQQGKHVPGHNNFQPGKSELTDPNPQGLLDQGAGTGQQVGNVPPGQPGSKERVDFGKNIGTYVDPVTGQRSPTNIGIIHNGSRGSHIVPARPGP
ncbi:MAG: polymorphic toxin type 50 domain-containing protein, partial [Giesbergeria sp.]